MGPKEGLAAARARGRVGGRPSVATEEIIRAARDLLPDPGRSITSITSIPGPLGVSPGSLHNRIRTCPSCAPARRRAGGGQV
ncbi:hypothetical protein [Streptomyces sp. NPDC058373]|uniref:hypothetical protein n=1 Tax=Streptomyces sp. NPDC058373 TaxID=3346465 RepID=UPI00365EDFC0